MIKSRLIIYVLIAVMATSINATTADAQWWKRKKENKHGHKNKAESEYAEAGERVNEADRPSKKELKRREKRARKRLKRARRRSHLAENKEEIKVMAVVTKKKKHEVEYPATKMKPSYRIDFLAALYLDDFARKGNLAFKGKIPEKAFPGISFYQGLNIAADSLKKAGFDVAVYVHDIVATNETPDALMANGRLDSADLIIGAFHSKDIAKLAEYAKQKQVNFISALSPADGGVKDNQFFTLVQPSLKSHCEWIIDDLAKKFPSRNVLLIHRAATQVDENAFNYLNAYNDGNVHFNDLICNGIPERESLAVLLDSTKTNVVVISVMSPSFADNFPHTNFEIYGMPSWTVIADIHEEGALPNLMVNVTMPFSIDLTAPVTKYVSKKFKSEYGGKASELVFRGFETMYWYANLLKQYGTIFNLDYADISAAPFTRYDIKLKRDKEGNALYHENKHIYLVRDGKEAVE
jgi:hypothetical protein